jgi:bifunctional non-homologous end joining protein LigD
VARGGALDALGLESADGHGQQVVSVYSVRPLPGAPVAAPLCWEELERPLEPRAFTMDVVRARLEREGDLFAQLLRHRQTLARIR